MDFPATARALHLYSFPHGAPTPHRVAYTEAPSLRSSRMCHLSLVDHEGSGPGHLVVEGPGRGVVGLGVPVDTVRAPAVRFRVDAFDQGARGARAAVRPGDEQVLQVTVAPCRPRRRVEDRVREPDEAAVVLGDQAEEAVRALVQPAERVPGDLCRHLVTVEGVVSVPERKPGVEISWLQGTDGGVHEAFSCLRARIRPPPRIRTIVETITTVESALITGLTPNLIIE